MELLHLGRNPFMNAAVIATAPLVLLMHATMPALTNGACAHRYTHVSAQGCHLCGGVQQQAKPPMH